MGAPISESGAARTGGATAAQNSMALLVAGDALHVNSQRLQQCGYVEFLASRHEAVTESVGRCAVL